MLPPMFSNGGVAQTGEQDLCKFLPDVYATRITSTCNGGLRLAWAYECKFHLSDKFDGSRRRLYPKKCSVCFEMFHIPKHRYLDINYCSKKCSGLDSRARVTVSCAWCDNEIERQLSDLNNSKSGLYFCNRLCKEEAQKLSRSEIKEIQPPHYGTATVPKRRLKRERAHRCEECGRSKWLGFPIPLEVHPVDGNDSNNDDSNLKLVCRNCHGLTPNWCGRNRGKGSKSRKLCMG